MSFKFVVCLREVSPMKWELWGIRVKGRNYAGWQRLLWMFLESWTVWASACFMPLVNWAGCLPDSCGSDCVTEAGGDKQSSSRRAGSAEWTEGSWRLSLDGLSQWTHRRTPWHARALHLSLLSIFMYSMWGLQRDTTLLCRSKVWVKVDPRNMFSTFVCKWRVSEQQKKKYDSTFSE